MKKLRQLLNDFFQDIDTDASIDSQVANAIVDVHLRLILSLQKKEMLRLVPEGKEPLSIKTNSPASVGFVEGFNLFREKVLENIEKSVK